MFLPASETVMVMIIVLHPVPPKALVSILRLLSLNPRRRIVFRLVPYGT